MALHAFLGICLYSITVRYAGPAMGQSIFSTPYTFTTFAGYCGAGSADGTGSQARFAAPGGVTVDGLGNIYVADTGNSAIRKVTPFGVVTTVAGLAGISGTNDGVGSAARFGDVRGLAMDGLGNIYVADGFNYNIRKVTPAGDVSTLAGWAGSFGTNDGLGSDARFASPTGIAVDSAGNVYVADGGNHTIRMVAPSGTVRTIAGAPGQFGALDGPGDMASFNDPSGVAIDSTGNLYVADRFNNVIRKMTCSGTNWTVTTFAGMASTFGADDGFGNLARFYEPCGVGVDGSGNIYVADAHNNAIRKMTPAGYVTTVAGTGTPFGGSTDGIGAGAQFNFPTGVVVDGNGNVAVADSGNGTIRLMTASGTNWVVRTVAGLPGGGAGEDGTGNSARFNGLTSVAVDAGGIVYVADTSNDTIRKVTPTGLVTTLAGLAKEPGSADQPGNPAQFATPIGVAVDRSGNVYVADEDGYTIRKVALVGTNWLVSTLAGTPYKSGTNDGVGNAAEFNFPGGVAVDGTGNVYVSDTGNGTIRKVTPNGVVTTVAGSPLRGGTNDGTGSAARFNQPHGLAVDDAGNIYVADCGNNLIRQVTPAGVVTTLAGMPRSIGTNDGVGSMAQFNQPFGVAVDAGRNIYVADSYNTTIRKLSYDGTNWQVTTLAGLAGQPGTNDGIGISAQFSLPNGVAVDGGGNVYVADTLGSTIRRVNPSGVVTTVAGLPGIFGSFDGTGSAAQFNRPFGIAVDNAGNVLVADTFNATIRKMRAAGSNWTVATLAGIAGNPGTNDEVGSAARFNQPSGVAVDGSGNVYIADTYNFTIRLVSPSGSVTTLAGKTGSAGTNDGIGNVAQFSYPQGVAVDDATNVYVADTGNCTIRKLTLDGTNWNVITLAGFAGVAGTNDGTGSSARFSGPVGLAVDRSGNLYVADMENQTIRRVSAGGVVTTLAGHAGVPGTSDGPVRRAQFSFPYGVAVDGVGNVYVADTGSAMIRRITDSGAVSTLAGSATVFGGNADGTGSAVQFARPQGIAVDQAGEVFVADFGNNTIRKGVPASSILGPRLYPASFIGGQFGFGMTGIVGLAIDVEASRDFDQWQWTGTYILNDGTNYFVNPTPVQPGARFFRARVR